MYLFPGAAPSAPAETRKKRPAAKTTGRTRPPRNDAERPKDQKHCSGFGGKITRLPMYLTHPLPAFHRGSITVTDSRGLSPHSMSPQAQRQLAQYSFRVYYSIWEGICKEVKSGRIFLRRTHPENLCILFEKAVVY